MPASQFQKELTKLESLLSSLNKKNKGSKNEYSYQNFSGGGKRNQQYGEEEEEYSNSEYYGGGKRNQQYGEEEEEYSNSEYYGGGGISDQKYGEELEYSNSKYNRQEDFSGGADGNSRFFKLVSVDGKSVDGGRYELPLTTKSGKPQTRGPKDKASSAFSEICQKNNQKGECSYKFAIQETTRGSDKKVYHYQGKRVKLSKPVVLKLKDSKTGKVKEVVKKFKNVITSLGSDHD